MSDECDPPVVNLAEARANRAPKATDYLSHRQAYLKTAERYIVKKLIEVVAQELEEQIKRVEREERKAILIQRLLARLGKNLGKDFDGNHS